LPPDLFLPALDQMHGDVRGFAALEPDFSLATCSISSAGSSRIP
jgi:hypothetical protein